VGRPRESDWTLVREADAAEDDVIEVVLLVPYRRASEVIRG